MLHFILAPSGVPQYFTTTKVTANSITFSWLPPLIHLRNGNITHYSLRCSYHNSTEIIITLEHLQIHDTTYLLINLLPYTNYFCNISAFTSGGEGPSANTVVRTNEDSKMVYFLIISIILSFIVPGIPSNLNISFINSTTLLLFWSQPLIPNGIIIKYTINCIGENNKNHTVVTSTTMTLVSDLSPYTNYICSVFGHTRVGMGPPITGEGQTDEDSESNKKCVLLIK